MKNKLSLSVLLIIVALVVSSCAKEFYSPDAYTLAKKHQSFAIIPPSVSIKSNKKVDANALKEQQTTESLNFQKEIYAWMLKRKMQGRVTQEIQDVETTNAKLSRAGYPETPLTTEELCALLEVDGVMTSRISMTKPMSEAAAVVVGLLVGVWGPTNEVSVSLSLSDCSKKKLIWNYDHTFSGGVGSSADRLVDDLMRRASRKMPYFQ